MNDYEGVSEITPPRQFYCGKCNIEMVEASEQHSLCQRCGKHGWLVLYKCLSCCSELVVFRQDRNEPPICHSCA